MAVTSLHLILTYECPFECDHCFVWSGPSAHRGVMSVEDLRTILREAKKVGTVTSIYFEGGEAFLYYPVLLKGLRMARKAGLDVGIVTNGYWATSYEDALEWLRPFKSIGIMDLSISNDPYHYGADELNRAEVARRAARDMGLPASFIAIEEPTPGDRQGRQGGPVKGGALMVRGRAARNLAWKMGKRPWRTFDRCRHENLADPQRVHLDPFGFVQVCQGIAIGNFRDKPLSKILKGYRPRADPVSGPLLRGGPKALVEAYHIAHDRAYVDECHLCYAARSALRERFPYILAPEQVYGIPP